jgi:hypothetical protein
MKPNAVVAARVRALEARQTEGEAMLAEHDEILRRLLEPAPAASPGNTAGGQRPEGYCVDALCRSMGGALGRSALYALWREGKGPAFIRVGGRRFIAPEARAAWLRKMEAEQLAARMAEAGEDVNAPAVF